ncbi:MAG TPA: N-acetyltransferase [Actinobacteria bacterium]|nr:N-acetyltransferase [Actinomycetota bacterium]
MAGRITAINIATLKNIPQPCRSCSYWESFLDTARTPSGGQGLRDKWFISTMRSWGECGKLIYVGDEAVAYAQYAPPCYFPKIKNYAAAPLSEDAIFLSCLYVLPPHRDKGHGKAILREIVKRLSKSGYRAIETFGNKTLENRPSAPFGFYMRNGFYIVRDDEKFPLMRLDLKSVLFWQDGLDAVLESIKLPLLNKETPVPY